MHKFNNLINLYNHTQSQSIFSWQRILLKLRISTRKSAWFKEETLRWAWFCILHSCATVPCAAEKFAEKFSQAELLREKSHPHPMFSGTFSSNHLGSSKNLRFFHGQAKLSEGTTQLLSQDYNYSNLNCMITLEYHVGLHNHYDW